MEQEKILKMHPDSNEANELRKKEADRKTVLMKTLEDLL